MELYALFDKIVEKHSDAERGRKELAETLCEGFLQLVSILSSPFVDLPSRCIPSSAKRSKREMKKFTLSVKRSFFPQEILSTR